MSAKKTNKLIQFWSDLKRRRVVRVIPVYAAAAFVILELVDILSDPLGLPDWTINLVLILLCIGFIISVILSWVYDVTPEGIQKTKPSKEIASVEAQPASKGWKIATFVSVLIIIAFVAFYIVGNAKRSSDISKLEKSVAVLPFENWSYEKEYAHLGDAIANEINTQLAKIKDFHVFSYTSTSHYEGPDKPSMPQIGRELGANIIIEGTVERQDKNVSIHVQVIQAENDNHIWAHEFKGPWKDILKIRAQIAVRIAEELKTMLSPEEIEQIENIPTKNPDAYNLYLKGRYFWYKRTEENIRKSIEYFEEAIRLDSEFALAYSSIADSYIALGEWGFSPSKEVFPKAKAAALKAIELDSELAEAHCAIASIIRDYDWDWPEAEKEYLKAIELNPKYPIAQMWYSEFLSNMGRHEEAIERIIHAQELDPLSPIIYTSAGAIVYNYARQFDKAILQCQKALEIDSNYVGARGMLVRNYIQLEQYEDAIKQSKILISLSGGNAGKVDLARAYALSGKHDEAEIILNEFIERQNQTHVISSSLAKIYLALDRKDQALEWLEKGLLNHEYHLIHLKEDPQWDDLRSEPRFMKILEEVGFE